MTQRDPSGTSPSRSPQRSLQGQSHTQSHSHAESQSSMPLPDQLDHAAPSHEQLNQGQDENQTHRPNLLGLGLQSTTSSTLSMSTPPRKEGGISAFPHLSHYITNLLASVASSTTLSPPKQQHPLAFSSSGESDEEPTPPGSRDETASSSTSAEKESVGTSASSNGDAQSQGQRRVSATSAASDGKGQGLGQADRDDLVRTIVELLDNEEEEKVKDVLRPHMGDMGSDEILMEQVCLDCMHRRRDDIEQLPFTPAHLTPSRPRLSPAVTAPLRPYTPSRVPSFRARTPLGRPQSPSLSSSSYFPSSSTPHSTFARTESASRLPTLSHPSSPALNAGPPGLSAKATAFNPSNLSPRLHSPSVNPPLSAPGGHSWIPADAWKGAPPDPPRTASPFAPGMTRSGSNLAIAAPLFSDQSSPFHSPIGTPLKSNIKIPDVFSSPSSTHGLVRTHSAAIIPDDDDDDEFSPFGTGLPKLHHHSPDMTMLNTGAKPFEPTFGAFGASQAANNVSRIVSSSSQGSSLEQEEDGGAGMTPLDVLHQVFTGVPRVELETALHQAGYDFETAMGILVAQNTAPRSGASTPGRASPRPMIGIGGRGAVPTNFNAPSTGYFSQGGRNVSGPTLAPGYGPGPGLGPGPGPGPGLGAGSMHGHGARTPGGLKMCRFFLNGECRRYDCRFSHDLDRALCRFWLRGNCAKGPNCEFLHQLPPNMSQFDPHALSNAMSRLELSSDGSYRGQSPNHTPTEEFPDLTGARFRPAGRFDPSRNRFANALKRPQGPAVDRGQSIQITGARMGLPPPQFQTSDRPSPLLSSNILPVPRPSHRIKLRAPLLLPTIRTGAGTNEQYLAARAAAIRLGHARNACLARAADAFRRGDGAAAKRFSREGKALNERMLAETAEAAAGLVRERRGELQVAVRERDPAWSDDPADRGFRGKEAGGGLGAVLGVASRLSVPGGQSMSAEERMECACDLHTLHGVEGVEVLGALLADLEKERYRGLTYILVGEEKHVGLQDPQRGASRVRLASSIKTFLAEEGYAWCDGKGWICVDSCRS